MEGVDSKELGELALQVCRGGVVLHTCWQAHNTHTFTCTCVCIHTYTSTCVYHACVSCMHKHTHTHTHIYHMNTHTHPQDLFLIQESQRQVFKERRVFLFRKALIITKKRRESSEKETYITKEKLMVSFDDCLQL